jgi:transglutaminase-like putative cysteine protease
VTQLYGLCGYGDQFLALDRIHGYVIRLDPNTDNTTVLNTTHTHIFRDANSLSYDGKWLWYTKGDRLYRCGLGVWQPEFIADLPDRGEGIAVWGTTVYVTCERRSVIYVLNGETGQVITQFRSPGVGLEGLAVDEDRLWVCDREEQTIFCLDRATGEQRFSLLTPFENPTGVAVIEAQGDRGQLWVLYSADERFIKDDPNSSDPYRLAVRDRSRFQRLSYQNLAPDHRPHTLSSGYRVEMCYVEELSFLDPITLKDVEWRIALPSCSDRQKVISVEPFGVPFTEEEQEGQRVAVFRFDQLTEQTRHIFGWRAVLELYSIKYQVLPQDVQEEPLPEGFERYLSDNEDLSMEHPTVSFAAREARRNETNPLRVMLCIRDYVYDRLSYRIRPHITPPHEVLDRGTGSCGEYVGVLLALSRLNGIPCRTIGRYKCPKDPDKFHVPLEPDYNHVWLEFYLPGVGWLPMESNPDDLGYGPYPLRFFMGLAWYHVEIGKGIRFEQVLVEGTPLKELPVDLSIGNLAMNHVRFKILGEIAPE